MSSYFDHFLMIFYFPYVTNMMVVLMTGFTMMLTINSITNLIPSSTQSILIFIGTHWKDNLKVNMGNLHKFYYWPILSLFVFILLINTLGFILHVFPMSTLINITFSLAVIMWTSIMLLAVSNFKSNFLALLMPSGAPLGLAPLLMLIEIMSNMSSPVALGMSLAANLTAGHMLMSILANFSMKMILMSSALMSTLPILMMIATTILEVAVMFMQAYVFTLLTTIYLKESIIIH